MFFKKLPAVLLFFAAITVNAQLNGLGAGFNLGAGKIEGNFPDLSSGAGSIYIEAKPWFAGHYSFRAEFRYARKIEYFIPEEREDAYYPFIRVFGLSAVTRQNVYRKIYIEESLGAIYLNDRVFEATWNPGISFTVMAGFDFREAGGMGVLLSGGINYGVTFTNSNASYLMAVIQLGYFMGEFY